MSVEPPRITQLAARVRWLDRYRRLVAIAIAMIVAPLLYRELSGEWPALTAGLLFVTAAVSTWWVVEVSLAFVMAWWETDIADHERDRGLPRAMIVRK